MSDKIRSSSLPFFCLKLSPSKKGKRQFSSVSWYFSLHFPFFVYCIRMLVRTACLTWYSFVKDINIALALAMKLCSSFSFLLNAPSRSGRIKASLIEYENQLCRWEWQMKIHRIWSKMILWSSIYQHFRCMAHSLLCKNEKETSPGTKGYNQPSMPRNKIW